MLELAILADREAIEAMAQQVHNLHVSWRPDAYEAVPELYPQTRFDEAVRQRQLYTAKLGGVVVGYVLLTIRTVEGLGRKKRKIMLVDEICVEESCRFQGIGKEMMGDAQVLARAFGCDGLQLGVDPHNDVAVGFYQKCGFQISSINMKKTV